MSQFLLTILRLDWLDRGMNKIHEVEGASTSTSEGRGFEGESQQVGVAVSSIKKPSEAGGGETCQDVEGKTYSGLEH